MDVRTALEVRGGGGGDESAVKCKVAHTVDVHVRRGREQTTWGDHRSLCENFQGYLINKHDENGWPASYGSHLKMVRERDVCLVHMKELQ